MTPTWVRRTGAGAVAGTAATLPMTGAMFAGKRMGLVDEVAPEKVTKGAMRKVTDPPEGAVHAVTPIAHVAFGAGCGAAYALLRRRLPVPEPVRGPLFAVGVLLASYQGWIPKAGVLPPLSVLPLGHRINLAASHLVYGAALGGLAPRLERRLAGSA